MRIRVNFAKTAEMRFTGHLDLHRTWERIFRRARLPLAYSQGFHPQPRINLAAALPLGFTSDAEVVDVWLEQDLPLDDIREALVPALPPGIRLLEITEAANSDPALQVQVRSSEYQVTLLDPCQNLDECIVRVLASDRLPRERRGKQYDLRPLVEELIPQANDDQGRCQILMRLAAREGATGRPEEVLVEMGIAPESVRVHRTRLIFGGSE